MSQKIQIWGVENMTPFLENIRWFSFFRIRILLE